MADGPEILCREHLSGFLVPLTPETHVCRVLKPGDPVEFRGALGEFVPAPGAGPALLIAGGIGVTPMRAMLLEFAKQARRAVLLYSVRAAAEAAFAGELQVCQAGLFRGYIYVCCRFRVGRSATAARGAAVLGARGRRGRLRRRAAGMASRPLYV